MARLQGFSALQRRIEGIGRSIEAGSIEASRKGAEIWAETFREALHEPKSGLMYGDHQASDEGEIPAAHKGPLEESIEIVDARTTSTVHVRSPHATDLEYGTENMAARPFVRPITARARDEINAVAVSSIRKNVRRR